MTKMVNINNIVNNISNNENMDTQTLSSKSLQFIRNNSSTRIFMVILYYFISFYCVFI